MTPRKPVKNERISSDWGRMVAETCRALSLMGDGVLRTPVGTSLFTPDKPGVSDVRGLRPFEAAPKWVSETRSENGQEVKEVKLYLYVEAGMAYRRGGQTPHSKGGIMPLACNGSNHASFMADGTGWISSSSLADNTTYLVFADIDLDGAGYTLEMATTQNDYKSFANPMAGHTHDIHPIALVEVGTAPYEVKVRQCHIGSVLGRKIVLPDTSIGTQQSLQYRISADDDDVWMQLFDFEAGTFHQWDEISTDSHGHTENEDLLVCRTMVRDVPTPYPRIAYTNMASILADEDVQDGIVSIVIAHGDELRVAIGADDDDDDEYQLQVSGNTTTWASGLTAYVAVSDDAWVTLESVINGLFAGQDANTFADRLKAIEDRLKAIEDRLEAIEDRLEAIEDMLGQQASAIDLLLSEVSNNSAAIQGWSSIISGLEARVTALENN